MESETKPKGIGQRPESCIAIPSTSAVSPANLVEIDALDTSLLKALPTDKDIIYELTCVHCYEDSSPPQRFCDFGHTICESCFQSQGFKTCPARFVGEEVETICGSGIQEISEAVRKTKHFQYFMQNSRYKCGAESLGCDAILSGNEIRDHEKQECKFSIIRNCQFHALGCRKIFSAFNEHVVHLLKEHNLPMTRSNKGRFVFEYDRQEYLETNVEFHRGIVPIIRAVIVEEDDGKIRSNILFAKDLENVTRIWIAYSGIIENYSLKATLLIYPSIEDKDEKAVEFKLPILPIAEAVRDLESSEAFIDISNDFLDKNMAVYLEDGKYFHATVTISKTEVEAESESREEEEEEIEERKEDTNVGENVKTKLGENNYETPSGSTSHSKMIFPKSTSYVIEEDTEKEEETDHEQEVVEEHGNNEEGATGTSQAEDATVGDDQIDYDESSNAEEKGNDKRSEEDFEEEEEVKVDDEVKYFPWAFEKPTKMTELEKETYELLDEMKEVIIKRRKSLSERTELFFLTQSQKKRIELLEGFFEVKFV